MKGRYKAAFIVPVGARKKLQEAGWEFETSSRISSKTKEFLVAALELKFSESYLGIESYANKNIKMSVICDAENQIESIHLQLRGDTLARVADIFRSGEFVEGSELFIPQEGAS